MIQQVLVEPMKLEQREAPVPDLARGDVLMRMQALTLCGSDVRVYTGEKTGGVRWPAVIGHEFVGEIVEVSDTADEHLLGTRRAAMPWVVCAQCGPCRRGQPNLCENVEIFGYQIPGAMAEYIRIPARAVANGNLVTVPEGIPAEVAALSEPLSCVYHGHLRCRITVGSSVLILGGGPIGMLHTMLALRAGATTVIVSEPQRNRAEAIAALGRVTVIDPTAQDLLEQVRSRTGGEGVDVAIVCIGHPALAQDAISATRAGGTVNLFAGFGHAGVGELDLNAIHYKQLDVIGNVDATVAEFRTASGLISGGHVDVSAMITHRFPLSEAAEALEAARSGKGVKVAVLPDS